MKAHAWDEVGCIVSEFDVPDEILHRSDPKKTMILLDYEIMEQIGEQDGKATFFRTGKFKSGNFKSVLFGIGRFGRDKLVIYTIGKKSKELLWKFDEWYCEKCEDDTPTNEEIIDYFKPIGE